jgi:hypothetical protein
MLGGKHDEQRARGAGRQPSQQLPGCKRPKQRVGANQPDADPRVGHEVAPTHLPGGLGQS